MIAFLAISVVIALLFSYGGIKPGTHYSFFGRILVVLVVGAMFFTDYYPVGYAFIGTIFLWESWFI